VDASTAISGGPEKEMTVIEDLDREGLVEHFAIEAEAKKIREWVAKNSPRPTGFDARIKLAEEQRKRGNVFFEKNEWDKAVWLYLAALHALDYSKKDRILDEIDETRQRQRTWQEATALVLSNMAAAFGAKDDNYNAIRAANLGLKFAEQLRTAGDRKEALRAKLHYRRGIAHSRSDAYDDALSDLTKAVNLDEGKDKAMLACLRRLKKTNKQQTKPFDSLKGKLSQDTCTKTTVNHTISTQDKNREEINSSTINAKIQSSQTATKSPAIIPERNLAERRAARRKLSARLMRLRKRWITPVYQAFIALRKLFGLIFFLIAFLIYMIRLRHLPIQSHKMDPAIKNMMQKSIRFAIFPIIIIFFHRLYSSRQRRYKPPLALLKELKEQQHANKYNNQKQ